MPPEQLDDRSASPDHSLYPRPASGLPLVSATPAAPQKQRRAHPGRRRTPIFVTLAGAGVILGGLTVLVTKVSTPAAAPITALATPRATPTATDVAALDANATSVWLSVQHATLALPGQWVVNAQRADDFTAARPGFTVEATTSRPDGAFAVISYEPSPNGDADATAFCRSVVTGDGHVYANGSTVHYVKTVRTASIAGHPACIVDGQTTDRTGTTTELVRVFATSADGSLTVFNTGVPAGAQPELDSVEKAVLAITA